MKQSKRGIKIGIQRTSFEDVKTQGRHHLFFDGTVLQFHLETKEDKAHLRLEKTLNQEVEIKHSSGAVGQEKSTLKNLLVYGALATGTFFVIRDPMPLFLLASGALCASYLFATKPTVRLIFDFAAHDADADAAYIIAEVPSVAAAELLTA